MPVLDRCFQDVARRIISIEANAVQKLINQIDQRFDQACELLINCTGKVIVCGIGKSGHIARKIAATLASTGTSAFYLHPAEANHGDMGMIAPGDAVIMISNSGETSELTGLLPYIQRLGCPIIALTNRAQSTLTRLATVSLVIDIDCEACPLGLAPTTSTTVTLVLGDAISLALLEARGFTAEDFANTHPGGNLGARLLQRVCDIMHQGDHIPSVSPDCLLVDAIVEMTKKSFGLTTIADPDNRLLGVFTDGDLRRVIDSHINLRETPISSIMTRQCITVCGQMLIGEAVNLIHQHQVSALVVTDEQQVITGIIHILDFIRCGVL